MSYTDYRAMKIHQATLALQTLAALVPQTSMEDMPQLMTSITAAKQQLADAEALPRHAYECSTHTEDGKPGSFQSPARTVYSLARIVEHDTEGNVISDHRFDPPVEIVECRECTEANHPIDYLTKRWDERASAEAIPQNVVD